MMAGLRYIWISMLLGSMFLAGAARALPPDRVVLMKVGSDRILPSAHGKWKVVSLDPKVVKAETFTTSEVHLTAVGKGASLLVFYNTKVKSVIIWNVRVAESKPKSLRPSPSVLRSKCECTHDGHSLSRRSERYPIECQVKTSDCLEAIRALLDKSDLTNSDVSLVYDVSVIQKMLIGMMPEIEKAGFKGIEVAFAGANLRLEGSVPSRARWVDLVAVVYRKMVGRMILDDRVVVPPAKTAEPSP